MVYEAGIKPLTSGQPCTNKQGQLFTVLGYNTLLNYQENDEANYSFTEQFPVEFNEK